MSMSTEVAAQRPPTQLGARKLILGISGQFETVPEIRSRNRSAWVMSDKSLNTLVSAYKKLLANGDIQTTYQSLVGIVQDLRTGFSKKYKGEFAVASVLHGYIDFTYFYLQNDYLKKNKLKYAIVLNHQKASFELWLLGQTKQIQSAYWKKLKGAKWVNETAMPEYSILEISLLESPDFDHQDELSESILSTFESLSKEILLMLEAYE